MTKIKINISIFFSFFIVGITLSIASPILIEISQKLSIQLVTMSLIYTFFFIGWGLGPHVGNLLIKVSNRKTIIGSSLLLQWLFLLLFPFTNNFYFAFFIYFVIGLCGGFLDMMLSAVIVEIHPEKQGFFLNISHIFLSIGAFVSPYIVSFVLKIGESWRLAFYISAAIAGINFFLFIFLKFPLQEENSKTAKDLTKDRSKDPIIGRNPIIIILVFAFAALLYTISESGINSWLPTFLRIQKQFNQIEASQVLSLFWLAIAIGRIVIGTVSLKINIIKLTIFISILGFICVIVGSLSKIISINYIFFFLAGFFYSGIFPNLLAISSQNIKGPKNVIFSFIVTAAAVGLLIAPQLVGIFHNYSSLYNGFIVLGLAALIQAILLIFFYFRKTVKSSRK
jgi:FHS family glucose/mannose:H+ symporter-like MFS transporter